MLDRIFFNRQFQVTLVTVGLLAVAMVVGRRIPGQPVVSWLLPTAALAFITLIWVSPYSGLLVIIILETFRVQDHGFTEGIWLTGAKAVGLITVAVFALQKVINRDLTIRRSPFDMPLLLFVIAHLVSLAWSLNWDIGVEIVISLTTLFGLYFLVNQLVTSEKKLINIVRLWILMGAVLLVMMTISEGWQVVLDPIRATRIRVGSEFGNPNAFALYLVLIIGPVMALFINANRLSTALIYLLLSAAFAYFLLISGSRAGWIGGFLAITVVMIGGRHYAFHSLKSNKNEVLARLKQLSLVVLVVGLLAVSWTGINNRLEGGTEGEAVRGVNTRSADWRASWHAFLTEPLWGIGIGSYQVLANSVYNDVLELSHVPKSPHNVYLGVLATTGLLGFLPLIWLYFRVFRVLKRGLASTFTSPQVASIALGLAGSFLGFSVFALFHNELFFNMLWIVLALIYVSHTMVTKTSSGTESLTPIR